jgi:hypothetical protein
MFEEVKNIHTHFYTNVDQSFSSEKGMSKVSGWLKVLVILKREGITINSWISKREMKNWGEVNLEDKLECHNPEIENQEAIFARLFQLDWFDHQTIRRAPLRFLDFSFFYIHLLMPTRLSSLFATLFTATMSSNHPPSKQSMDNVAEMLSSIQQQMQLLNPPKEAGEGLQMDFTSTAEEDPFLSRLSI